MTSTTFVKSRSDSIAPKAHIDDHIIVHSIIDRSKGKPFKRSVISCPQCDVAVGSDHFKRHLRTHNIDEGEIQKISALTKVRKNGDDDGTGGAEVKKCPYCGNVVSIILLYMSYFIDKNSHLK